MIRLSIKTIYLTDLTFPKETPLVLVVCGPTATGKTSLAFEIAKRLGSCTIISVDSRQVYRGLDLLTGKDQPTDLSSRTNFIGIDLFSPDQTANLAEITFFVRSEIKKSTSKNIPVILVGGTGLYLKSITSSLNDIYIKPDLELRHELSNLSVSELQDKLKKIDKVRFDSLNHSDQSNPRRLTRHIEIAKAKQNISVAPNPSTYDQAQKYYWVGLTQDMANLESSINQRVISRLKKGAIEEVRNLLVSIPDRNLPIYTSLGVKEILLFLDHQISEAELIRLWTRSELQYAKRQMVWFKKQPDIIWYDKDIDRAQLADQLATKIINQNGLKQKSHR